MVHFTYSESTLHKCMVGITMTDAFLPKKAEVPISATVPLCTKTAPSSKGTMSCEEKYFVPVVWHIIMHSEISSMNINVSDKMIRKEMNILNGMVICFIFYMFYSFFIYI